MNTAAAAMSGSEINTELARRRTGMSFQRTRLSADRTLMSVIRTSLALISFGFTIYNFFHELKVSGVLKGTAGTRHFGTTLVLLGITMLVLGIIYHVLFMLDLRELREKMRSESLIHAESKFPPSLVLIVAVILLLIGIAAALSMILNLGPWV